jgi:hypothetical protein
MREKHGACQIDNYLKLFADYAFSRGNERNFLFLFFAITGHRRGQSAFDELGMIKCCAEKHHFYNALQINKN